jgi:hypothetical protein
LGIAALSALTPRSAGAGPARVDGLVGHPSTARNFVLVNDDLNQFVNPALAWRHRNRILVSLGLNSAAAWSPFGGANVQLGPLALGIYVNRGMGQFSDLWALNNVVGNMTSGGGHGAALTYTGGGTAPLFLPIDVLLAADLGALRLGAGVQAAFGRTRTESLSRLSVDPSEYYASTATLQSNLIGLSGGVAIDAGVVEPEIWVRGGMSTAWNDSFATPPAGPDVRPDLDVTEGYRGTGTIGGGLRVALDLGQVMLLPAVAAQFARGEPYLTDRLAALPIEDTVMQVSGLSAMAGLGAEYTPDPRFRAVGTVSLEYDMVTADGNNGETGDLLAGASTRISSLRAPILSFGAEANPWGPLWIRGSARGGVLGAPSGLRVWTYDVDGVVLETSTRHALGPVSFSASAGAALHWDAVEVAANFGGFLQSPAVGLPSIGARFWLDVLLFVPPPGSKKPVTVTPN